MIRGNFYKFFFTRIKSKLKVLQAPKVIIYRDMFIVKNIV